MSKLLSNEEGIYQKTIVSSSESIDESRNIVDAICSNMKMFDSEKRIVTSVDLSVHYCNTDATPISREDFKAPLRTDNMMSWEFSHMELGTRLTSEYRDNMNTMRDKIIQYMDDTCKRGMLDECQYRRFAETITTLYEFLTNLKRDRETESINKIISMMELDYMVKEYPATTACPDQFFKLVRLDCKVKEEPKVDMEAAMKELMKHRLDDLMTKWFRRGSGKIFDGERDEFYAEFMEVYESRNTTDEKGTIPVYRKGQVPDKKVIGMKKMFNYVEINSILKEYGLNYHITYQQETDKTDDGLRRRNALSMKADE